MTTKLKNMYYLTKTKLRACMEYILEIDFDFMFLFLASFVMTYNYSWWVRLMFSIGIIYLYKMIKKDIANLKMIKR